MSAISPTSSSATHARPGPTTKQKAGLVLAMLYGLANIPGFLAGEPDAGEEGPPASILVIGSILGVIILVGAIRAWRGNKVALRVAAGAMILITLTGLPALFVDVPTAIKALVGVSVLLTVAAVVLMFSGDRRPSTVVD
jgi:hypothetical protein